MMLKLLRLWPIISLLVAAPLNPNLEKDGTEDDFVTDDLEGVGQINSTREPRLIIEGGNIDFSGKMSSISSDLTSQENQSQESKVDSEVQDKRPKTLRGSTFLVVAGDHVEEQFNYIESAKAKLLKVTSRPRMIVEVESNGKLMIDPRVVGGQNQEAGGGAGFNQYWESSKDIYNMMDVAQRYLGKKGCYPDTSMRDRDLCCTEEHPCREGEGACDDNNDCLGDLMCGTDNCQKWNPDAPNDHKCCEKRITDGTCYEDDEDRLLDHYIHSDTNTPEQCQENCAINGYGYAGVQNSECYCGNNAPPTSRIRSSSECSTKCPGNDALMCGGLERMHIYEIKSAGITDGTCYEDDEDRLLDHYFHSETNTPEQCQENCATKGYNYAGVQNSHECYCGNNEPPVSRIRSSLECSAKCPGNDALMCGGPGRMNIYQIQSAACTGTPPYISYGSWKCDDDLTRCQLICTPGYSPVMHKIKCVNGQWNRTINHICAPTMSNKVYLLVGGEGAKTNVELYHPTLGSPSCKSPPPQLTQDWFYHTSFFHDATIYLCGGRKTKSDCLSLNTQTASSWTTHSLPSPLGYGLSSLVFNDKVLGDKVVFIGGKYSKYNYNSATYTTLPLTSSLTLTSVPNLSYKGLGQCVAKLSPSSFIISGGDFNGMTLSTVLLYDLETESVTKLASLSPPRRDHSCITVEEEGKRWLIVTGGYDGTDPRPRPLATTQRLDREANTWEDLRDLKETRRAHTMINSESRGVMVMGGFDINSKKLNSVEVLVNKEWQSLEPSLVTARSFFGLAVEVSADLFSCQLDIETGNNVYFSAAMSSNYKDKYGGEEGKYPADNCLDGDVRTFCSTDEEENPYFMIKYPDPVVVTEVKVMPRTDNSNWEKAEEIVVIVTNQKPTKGLSALGSGFQLGHRYKGPATSQEVITFNGAKVTGKYVVVQQQYKGKMSLAEVRVQAAREFPCPSINTNTQYRQDEEVLKNIPNAGECSTKCRDRKKITCNFWTWHHAGVGTFDCVLMSAYGFINTNDNVISGERSCYPQEIDESCYQYESRMVEQPVGETNSRDKCIEICYGLRYSYAGVTDGSKCFCDDQKPAIKLSSWWCDKICPGNSSQKCGGLLGMNIHSTGMTGSSTSGGPISGGFEIGSLVGVAKYHANLMGRYHVTDETVNGFPVYMKGGQYIYADKEGLWTVGKDTSRGDGEIYHPVPSPTPPYDGWLFWNYDAQDSQNDKTLSFKHIRGNCLSGWNSTETGCYKFVDGLNWTDGAINCQKAGGYLAEINSQKEQDALWKFYRESGLSVGHVYIGAKDTAGEGTWLWDHSGSEMTFTAWSKDEPNGGNCLIASTASNDNFTWVDIPCDLQFEDSKAICESLRTGCHAMDKALTDLSSAEVMKSNGWRTKYGAPNAEDSSVDQSCIDEVGTLSATFTGYGKVIVDFGNCFYRGNVKLYVNDTLTASAPGGTRSKIAEFPFSPRTVITLEDGDGNAAIRVNSITVNCHAIDGAWTSFGKCSKACEGGVQKRFCTNPSPQNWGKECTGKDTQVCNDVKCTDSGELGFMMVSISSLGLGKLATVAEVEANHEKVFDLLDSESVCLLDGGRIKGYGLDSTEEIEVGDFGIGEDFTHKIVVSSRTEEPCNFIEDDPVDPVKKDDSTYSPHDGRAVYDWKSAKESEYNTIRYYFSEQKGKKPLDSDINLVREVMDLIENKTKQGTQQGFIFTEIKRKQRIAGWKDKHCLEIKIVPRDCCECAAGRVKIVRNRLQMVFTNSRLIDGDCKRYGLVLHELMHVLGVGHTQRRWDRDEYITVLEDNFKEEFGLLAKDQYRECTGCKVCKGIDYDCDSIMHYPSVWRKETVITIKNSTCTLSEQKNWDKIKEEISEYGTEMDWKLLNMIAHGTCEEMKKP